MRSVMRYAALAAVACCAVWLAGCGNKYVQEERLSTTGATLEGTVTYGKDQVLVAMIIVQGDGGASTAFIGEDGRYKVENVPLGTVHVAVNTAAGKGQMMGKLVAQGQGKGQGPVPKMIDVPAKYGEPATSGITTTVNKGQNTFDVVIPR